MELIKNQEFGGERPLFTIHDTRLENITITDGESGIKQCQRVEASNCRFYGKYPWWHVDGALIEDCYFALDSRSAIWYTNDLVMRRCRIDAPKFFREMKNVELEDVQICDADETFWRVDGLKLRNVKLHGGTYPFMFSKNIYVTVWRATQSTSSSTVRMSRYTMPRYLPRTPSGSARTSPSTTPSWTANTWLGTQRTYVWLTVTWPVNSCCATPAAWY